MEYIRHPSRFTKSISQASSGIIKTYDKYKNLAFIRKADLLRKEPME
jgi:hypothetical protein